MKWFEAFKQKRTPGHERDAPQAEVKSDVAVQGETYSKHLSESGEPLKRLALLTPRERELFLLLLEGYTLKESAKQLTIKYSTANTHMTGIYKKLIVSSRAELIIRYRDTIKKNE
ncbi:MAG: LuxR C-terminal-related transcriptional regulator [Clostridiaceae bacterium]|nr:LuxR C-terminal-related transcriptional regulator [Clostridiaceae bacterium]